MTKKERIIFYVGACAIGVATGFMQVTIIWFIGIDITAFTLWSIIWNYYCYHKADKTTMDYIPDVTQLTNGQAEKAYDSGMINKEYKYSRYVPWGFYGKCLNFEEWLKYYYIQII
jgi:hypothetical protein